MQCRKKRTDYQLVIANLVLCPIYLAAYLWMGAVRSFADDVRVQSEGALVAHISASVNAPTVPFLQPVILTVTLHNNGDVPAQIASRRSLLDCEVRVIDDQGAQVPMTLHGQSLKRELSRRGTTILTVQPGGHRIFEVPVNLIYDMTMAGEYTINATLLVFADVDGERQALILESEPLTVGVGRKIGWLRGDGQRDGESDHYYSGH